MKYENQFNWEEFKEYKYGKLFINIARFINSINAIGRNIQISNGAIKFNEKRLVPLNEGKPFDHTDRIIPRRNNDTIYGVSFLDIKNGPIIYDFKEGAYPSDVAKHLSVSLTTLGHHTHTILTTARNGKTHGKIIFVWKGYKGDYPTDGKVVFLESTVSALVLRVAIDNSNEEHRKKVNDFFASINIEAPKTRTFEEVFPKELLEEKVINVFPKIKGILEFIKREIIIEPNEYSTDKEFIDTLNEYGIVFGDEIDISSIDIEKFEEESPKIFNAFFNIVSSNKSINNKWAIERMFNKEEFALSKEEYNDRDPLSINIAAIIGPLALDSRIAQYQIETNDINGNELLSNNNYRIWIDGEAIDNLVNSFWSVTLYEKETGYFFENEEFVYSSGSLVNLPKNSDGNYEVYVGPNKPEKMLSKYSWLSTGKENNNVPFDLAFRFYEPNGEHVFEMLIKNKSKYIKIEKI